MKKYFSLNMFYIGIDPSIQSSGLCVWNDVNNTNIYYIISSKMTKKMLSFSNPYIKYLPYEKISTTDLEYSEKEQVKTRNLMKIISNIVNVIDNLNDDNVACCMEGISYGSAGAGQVADLAGLNYLIRRELYIRNIPFIIVPPTRLKSWATGNGAADKDMMIANWRLLDNNISNIKDLKIDDCADAFFLAHYKPE